MSGVRAFVPVMICALFVILPMTAVTIAADGTPDMMDEKPLVPKPNGNGPYNVGWTIDAVRYSTKDYDTNIKLYYPAMATGQDPTPNATGGPYPMVIWYPGTGGTHLSYVSWLNPLSSWGFIAVACDVNMSDWPNNGNVSDTNDLIDYMTALNESGSGHPLEGLIDIEHIGISGHSMGGGMSVAMGAMVSRISAVHTFAAAIVGSSVQGLASAYDDKVIWCQIGEDDTTYKQGSQAVWQYVEGMRTYVEILGAGHQGPFEFWQWHAFYMYWFQGKTEYWPYLYGEEVVDGYVKDDYILKFWYNDTHFFPPEIGTISSDVTTVNMDEPVNFTATTAGYVPDGLSDFKYEWDFDNDGTWDHSSAVTPTTEHTYIYPGIYRANFKMSFGDNEMTADTPIDIIVENVDPVAGAGDDLTGDEDWIIHFDGGQSNDTISDRFDLEYKWEFGDGAKTVYSLDPKTTHAYVSSGVYTAKLTVRDPHGAEASDTLEVTISNVGPTAQAGDDIVADEDQEVLLTGTGMDTASDVPGLEYKWDLGDGTSTDYSDSPNVTAVYPKAGNYTAVLQVRDDDGLTAVSNLTVHVQNVKPQATITYPGMDDVFAEDEPIEFSGMGSDTASDMATGLEYMWDFGDGEVSAWSTDPATEHSYSVGGDFDVMLNVRDDDGHTGLHAILITIENMAPTAAIDLPATDVTVNEDELVIFSGTGTDSASDQDLLVYEWDIDGTAYAGAEVYHTFTAEGAYDVTFAVSDPDGVATTDVITVTVRNVPPTISSAELSTGTALIGKPLNFTVSPTDTSSDVDGLTVRWDFGDGTTSSNKSGTHTYTKAAKYDVKVTVRDDDGDESSMTFTVDVKDPGGGGGEGGGSGSDDTGTEGVLYAGIGAIVVVFIIVFLLAFILSRRRKGPVIPKDQGGPEDEPWTSPYQALDDKPDEPMPEPLEEGESGPETVTDPEKKEEG